ncbi:MAG: AIR synthase family protein [Methanomicrobiales archaeon]|nr:AIR synthase family protein [Methanomicrobiales archaeon]
MKIGKISREVFSSVIRERLGRENERVIVPPAAGIDAGVIDIGNGQVLLVAEDPIFAIPGQPLEMFGWYTVHIGASDIAVMGVRPQYMTYSLLMPPEFSEKDFILVADSIHQAAKDLGIAIVGGHTGHYPGFAAPTIGGITVFAIAKREEYITPAGACPGDSVLLTKGPAIETAGILSVLRERELLSKYPPHLVKKAQGLASQMSVVSDALTAMEAGGVTAMHDATEGGVKGGLYEIAEASCVGMEIDESLFIYPEEVRMVCEYFALDPVAAIAEGSLLITARAGSADRIIFALKNAGIPASVIGRVTDDPKSRWMTRSDGRREQLEMPVQDPFWPVFFESIAGTQ